MNTYLYAPFMGFVSTAAVDDTWSLVSDADD